MKAYNELEREGLLALRQGAGAFVGEDKRLYSYITVEQMVRFMASFYPDWRLERAARLLREYDLPGRRNVRAVSKRMRTKLALLLAFARRPEVLLLDRHTLLFVRAFP